jgi:5-methyltetrahydropteroyltriglutamate--homocysteine methyltransferase
VREAVAEVVRRQAESGVDIVNDGEMSKPSYATYIKDRLSGFGGDGQHVRLPGPRDFPELAKRVFGDPGRSRRKTPRATRRSRCATRRRRRSTSTSEGLRLGRAKRGSSPGASPGVVSLFFRNEHYPSEEAYVFAIADAMRSEYEAIGKAGIVLQIDCPDLGMGRHIQYASLSLPEWRKKAQMHVEALNHAVANVPAELLRMHLCWGNYEGPHHCDVPLADVIDIVFKAKPMADRAGSGEPAACARVEGVRDVKLPEGKLLIPASSSRSRTSSSIPSSSRIGLGTTRSWSGART